MSTRISILGIIMPVMALCACEMQQRDDAVQKAIPVSAFEYRLEVDHDSLPAGVTAHERRVPVSGQVQTWLQNDTAIPFTILSTDPQGNVTGQSKLVEGKVYLGQPTAEGMQEQQWQVLDGVSQTLLFLNYTPQAIVDGRSKNAADVPSPEPFSIRATFGDKPSPIRGSIVYSRPSRSE